MDMNVPKSALLLRKPQAQDGAALHALIEACPPLDLNSVYCYLLQCSHFAATSVVAERAGELVGAITGYRPPAQGDTLFIWQVAVDEEARGHGLAGRLLDYLIGGNGEIRYLQTTVSPSNKASRRLFEKLSARLDTRLSIEEGFPQSLFPDGLHEAEPLLTIGPFSPVEALQP